MAGGQRQQVFGKEFLQKWNRRPVDRAWSAFSLHMKVTGACMSVWYFSRDHSCRWRFRRSQPWSELQLSSREPRWLQGMRCMGQSCCSSMEEQTKRGMFSVRHLPLWDLLISQWSIVFSSQYPAPGHHLKGVTVWILLSNAAAQKLPPKPQPVAKVTALAQVRKTSLATCDAIYRQVSTEQIYKTRAWCVLRSAAKQIGSGGNPLWWECLWPFSTTDCLLTY